MNRTVNGRNVSFLRRRQAPGWECMALCFGFAGRRTAVSLRRNRAAECRPCDRGHDDEMEWTMAPTAARAGANCFDRITFDPEVMGSRACIRGMRVTVATCRPDCRGILR